MPSPFPGMDPYLETTDRWRIIHNNLATEIQAQLAPLLRPRYYVDQEPRFVYETGLEIATKRQALPDVSILESPLPAPLTSTNVGQIVAIAPAPWPKSGRCVSKSLSQFCPCPSCPPTLTYR